MRKELIHPDKALEILRPKIELVQGIVFASRDKWFLQAQKTPSTQIDLGPTARAASINDWQVAEARRVFAPIPGVREVPHQGFDSWVIDELLALRFKKFKDRNFRVSGWETDQAKAFDGQEQLEGMPPKATNLVVGYLWNGMETDFAQVAIACKTRNRVHFHLDITVPGANGVTVVHHRSFEDHRHSVRAESENPRKEDETGSDE